LLEPGASTWIRPPAPNKTAAAPAPVIIINNYYTIIVIVMQLKAPYAMSEVTEEVRYKFAMAIADALGVNTSNVVLSFRSVDVRRGRSLLQSGGVFVDVSIRGAIDSQSFRSRLSQDALNAQMARQGLRSVQISSEARVAAAATPSPSAAAGRAPTGDGRLLLLGMLLALVLPVTARHGVLPVTAAIGAEAEGGTLPVPAAGPLAPVPLC
jgi:hypothetical protein